MEESRKYFIFRNILYIPFIMLFVYDIIHSDLFLYNIINSMNSYGRGFNRGIIALFFTSYSIVLAFDFLLFKYSKKLLTYFSKSNKYLIFLLLPIVNLIFWSYWQLKYEKNIV